LPGNVSGLNKELLHPLLALCCAGMLQPVVASLHEGRSPGLASLIDDVWPLLQHMLSAHNLTQQQVLAAASAAISRIQEVVCEQDAAAAAAAAAAVSSSRVEGPFEAAANDAVEQLSERMELWRRKVKPAALGMAASEVRMMMGGGWFAVSVNAHATGAGRLTQGHLVLLLLLLLPCNAPCCVCLQACDAFDDLVVACEALLAAATQAAMAGVAGLKPRDKPLLNVDLNNE
jgi:hypothetical protein